MLPRHGNERKKNQEIQHKMKNEWAWQLQKKRKMIVWAIIITFVIIKAYLDREEKQSVKQCDRAVADLPTEEVPGATCFL